MDGQPRPGFSSASDVHPALTATAAQGVRIVVVDVRAPPNVQRAATRLIRAVYASSTELTAGRDHITLIAVGGAPEDPSPVELLSTLSKGSLADPLFEKTCVGRLLQSATDAVRKATTVPKGKDYCAETVAELITRVLNYISGRYGAARMHLYIAAYVEEDEFLDAAVASGALHSVQTLQEDRDPWLLFGEAFACLMASRITLKVGTTIMQLVARPRIRGVGCLPATLSLTAIRRVGIDSIPEDVLFGIPTALLPDSDCAEDVASRTDARAFAELASALFDREEALVLAERAGPHLVLMPASPSLLLLREIASKENLLPQSNSPTPLDKGPYASPALPGHAFSIVDTVILSTFNPLQLDGVGNGSGASSPTRMVGFSA